MSLELIAALLLTAVYIAFYERRLRRVEESHLALVRAMADDAKSRAELGVAFFTPPSAEEMEAVERAAAEEAEG